MRVKIMNFSQNNIIKFIFLMALLTAINSHFSLCSFLQKQEQNTQTKVSLAKTIFVFLGSPGAGKGTLAEQCASQLDFKVLSAGNLCREEIASGSEKGKIIKDYSMRVGLIPDEIITDMVEVWLGKQTGNKTIILDGYPRTKKQASMLLSLLENKFPDYCFRIIFLQINDQEEIIQRLYRRLICKNKKCQSVYSLALVKDINQQVCNKCGSMLVRREDDTEEVIRIRLESFAKNNDEIIAFYNNIGIKVELINVSNVSPEDVFANFKNILAIPLCIS